MTGYFSAKAAASAPVATAWTGGSLASAPAAVKPAAPRWMSPLTALDHGHSWPHRQQFPVVF